MALRRVRGSHTFDVIAEYVESIHSQFGIRRKTVRTTTDSGSNFVKAFALFGEQAVPEADDGSSDEFIAENAEIVDLSSILSDNTSDYELPRHQRCAAHSLNLVSDD